MTGKVPTYLFRAEAPAERWLWHTSFLKISKQSRELFRIPSRYSLNANVANILKMEIHFKPSIAIPLEISPFGLGGKLSKLLGRRQRDYLASINHRKCSCPHMIWSESAIVVVTVRVRVFSHHDIDGLRRFSVYTFFDCNDTTKSHIAAWAVHSCISLGSRLPQFYFRLPFDLSICGSFADHPTARTGTTSLPAALKDDTHFNALTWIEALFPVVINIDITFRRGVLNSKLSSSDLEACLAILAEVCL
jgi:hypothetical protein